MQSIFSNALSRAVAKHIGLSATRQETLVVAKLLIMQHGTISLWRLAPMWQAWRRRPRCSGGFTVFPVCALDGAHSARVVVELLGLSDKPWVLAIDRTNWDFGKTTINILMISVTWNGMGIPLLWMVLPTGKFEHLGTNRASGSPARGISGHEDCGTDGRSRVYWRCMDAYLQREKIAFILRLRENQHGLRAGYAAMPISVIAQHLKVGDKMIVKGSCWLGRDNNTLSASVRLVMMRLASGELLALAVLAGRVMRSRVIANAGPSKPCSEISKPRASRWRPRT